MEILNDILEQNKKQSTEIELLKQAIESLNKQINNPKPVNLDAEKVANGIWMQLQPKSNELSKKLEQFENTASKIPTEIKNKTNYGITLNTKIWLSLIFLSLIIGFLFAPKAIQKAEYETLKFKLEYREKQIENFSEKNPRLGEKYF